MKRRRFLAISAAAIAAPAGAQTTTWRGYALGAEVSLTFAADPATAAAAIEKVTALLQDCEDQFSLYRPSSALSQLNSQGSLRNPSPQFFQLLLACQEAHTLTGGQFDPTVQPLWEALAKGRDLDAAKGLIGWDRVKISPDRIILGRGQKLTLNGIAQGYATDMVASALKQSGWTKVLVNVGEFHAGGKVWTLGISDPRHGIVQTVQLKDRAIATSSPQAMRLSAEHTHILDPRNHGAPVWSTVSVEASNATTADALSTAFCYLSVDGIERTLAKTNGNPSAYCLSSGGRVRHLTA
ncbi:Thiamine biosynthesis lipoprotein ApbE precursor [Ruegeria sp. THAF57]|uniref:FAD:protein FMN transferase n=1 Tax=Ruegeria sp. THAF57 TaxID=2744555 RepID=UPI0015DFB5E4|nr:FAD:protein FMN transferase [Ruegeria sp. THAF57]CAD0187006.1 Thiamine biosynthesis lipoprotein ApbE precursor [Ruegeria sp. THAF57]